jgi:hypothetical protein
MKPAAYLINTARGPLIDEAALARALREGWIAGAALDVFNTEPLPAGHPFRTAPNLVLTPHQASFAKETAEGVSYAARPLWRRCTGANRGGWWMRRSMARRRFAWDSARADTPSQSPESPAFLECTRRSPALPPQDAEGARADRSDRSTGFFRATRWSGFCPKAGSNW